MAKRVNYKYGLTVIVAANLADMTIEDDFQELREYLSETNIYFMGVSNGAIQGIQREYGNINIYPGGAQLDTNPDVNFIHILTKIS